MGHFDGTLSVESPAESTETKSTAYEPPPKTFNCRFLTRNLVPASRCPWEPP
jgi:hypothetical protein